MFKIFAILRLKFPHEILQLNYKNIIPNVTIVTAEKSELGFALILERTKKSRGENVAGIVTIEISRLSRLFLSATICFLTYFEI